ncbi:alpha/beta fold hydrolase [Spirillospora sp. NBC_01491]|uniref:alpha/beta fold hydrolase n=1 Tax=Spirillospora sp. NBC_01491 TaxID=2976007 RepID=UPI002E34A9DB|nr:alpha/beta hydrolase [Spirillospora sp. NBC_01491]
MHKVITGDGRTLAAEEWGVPDGTPVLSLHGTPMGRLARYPDGELFDRLGIRLITYDRPGFGASEAAPGRVVADAAGDAVAIADALGIGRFAVFGVSGGGPHALAVAAAHPDRVTRVATLAGMAPRDAAGLDWTAGMMAGNQVSAIAALLGRAAVHTHLSAVGSAAPPALPEAEQTVLARPAIRDMLGAAFAEAMRPGLDGWVDDVVALWGSPWGFDAASVGVPVRIWHGAQDSVVPVAHGEWLAGRIPGATLVRQEDAGHAGHFDATPATLEWLLAADRAAA